MLEEYFQHKLFYAGSDGKPWFGRKYRNQKIVILAKLLLKRSAPMQSARKQFGNRLSNLSNWAENAILYFACQDLLK